MRWYQMLFLALRMILHLPGLLVGWLYAGFFVWAAHKYRIEYPLILTAQFRDFAAEKWHFSTTLSRGMLMQKYSRRVDRKDTLTRTEEHERVHVIQTEDLALLGVVLGIIVSVVTGSWWWFLTLWGTSPFYQLPNFVGSLLRNAKPRPEGVSWYKHWIIAIMYRASEHERSAYSQTDR